MLNNIFNIFKKNSTTQLPQVKSIDTFGVTRVLTPLWTSPTMGCAYGSSTSFKIRFESDKDINLDNSYIKSLHNFHKFMGSLNGKIKLNGDCMPTNILSLTLIKGLQGVIIDGNPLLESVINTHIQDANLLQEALLDMNLPELAKF